MSCMILTFFFVEKTDNSKKLMKLSVKLKIINLKKHLKSDFLNKLLVNNLF